jgi:hypothetical protein
MDSEDEKDLDERDQRSSERLDDVNGWNWQVAHARSMYVRVGIALCEWLEVMGGDRV